MNNPRHGVYSGPVDVGEMLVWTRQTDSVGHTEVLLVLRLLGDTRRASYLWDNGVVQTASNTVNHSESEWIRL